jgi:pimeloyl-ACP methyl ester carboxylesterase
MRRKCTPGRQLGAGATRIIGTELAPEIDVPALVLWGKEDPVVPVPYAEAFHVGFPNSTLTYLNAGHSPQFEIPDVV